MENGREALHEGPRFYLLEKHRPAVESLLKESVVVVEDGYKSPEQVFYSICMQYMANDLLKNGEIYTFFSAEALADKYKDFFDINDFSAVCSVLAKYCDVSK